MIRTLGKGLVEITSPQGMAAETASAAIILSSSHLGMALSTTHVATGSILGSGVGKPGATVRWGVAGRMGMAWLITMPAPAWSALLCWFIASALGGGYLGVTMVGAILIAAACRHVHPLPPDRNHSGQRQRGMAAAGWAVEDIGERRRSPDARLSHQARLSPPRDGSR